MSELGRPDSWDVFVSYSRSDAELLDRFVPALTARGLRVFVDDAAVDDFGSITATITRGLAQSKVLLALYSAEYPRRRACQWELTYAYLSGQREGDPRRRVLVVNPEPVAGHVHPVELRDARHWSLPGDEQCGTRLAARVAEHLSALRTPMGPMGPMGHPAAAPPVPWLPAPSRTSSHRFTGRLAEQWRIHTALHQHRTPLVAPAGDGRTAQLRGMPGIGKSLLAQEYALRFGPSYPGGIFWFDLHRQDGRVPSDVLDAYREQVSTVVSALGLDAQGASLPRHLSRLAVALSERNAPCLWVIDGLPGGLPAEVLDMLRGPHLLAATLVTTRSLRYPSFAEPVDLGPLPDPDAYQLIVSRRAPESAAERAAAQLIIRDLGGHPQALDIIAERSVAEDFTHLRRRLHNPVTDVLSLWGQRPAAERTVTERTVTEQAAAQRTAAREPLTTTLLTRPMTPRSPVSDVLRLLAVASPAALSQQSMSAALAMVGPYRAWDTPHQVADAVDTLLGDGAVQPLPAAGSGSWAVHPLLARAVQRHDADTARREDLRRALLHTLAAANTPILDADSAAPAEREHPVPKSSAPSTSDAERAAAFDLQVELVTRVGVQPLAPDQGSLREALTSLHSLCRTGRETLHRVSAGAPDGSALPGIVSALVNEHLRPFLSTWHAALQVHEASRPEGVSAVEHERLWDRSPEMRAALADLRQPLTSIAGELAALSGTRLLRPATD